VPGVDGVVPVDRCRLTPEQASCRRDCISDEAEALAGGSPERLLARRRLAPRCRALALGPVIALFHEPLGLANDWSNALAEVAYAPSGATNISKMGCNCEWPSSTSTHSSWASTHRSPARLLRRTPLLDRGEPAERVHRVIEHFGL
jgi:hypothetical protein